MDKLGTTFMRTTLQRTFLLLLIACGLHTAVWAGEATPAADNPVLEARMLAIATELRCLVCQNQTIADSHSGLAVDLRKEIRSLLDKGQSDQQVRDYMTARYGDFILYRPPVNNSTALLWFGPGVLALIGLVTLWLILRRRARMSADAFDPDLPDGSDQV
ncbi:MAG: cytochrome c-type biogenesis protein CcmH [Aquabacterium sp.]|nr:cytochrome c-type biogenesis protein CcmH [Aquabacterium sp.]